MGVYPDARDHAAVPVPGGVWIWYVYSLFRLPMVVVHSEAHQPCRDDTGKLMPEVFGNAALHQVVRGQRAIAVRTSPGDAGSPKQSPHESSVPVISGMQSPETEMSADEVVTNVPAQHRTWREGKPSGPYPGAPNTFREQVSPGRSYSKVKESDRVCLNTAQRKAGLLRAHGTGLPSMDKPCAEAIRN